MVERARRVQTELESISLDVKALHSEVSGIVRLGVIGTTGRWVSPILLESMTQKFPRVRIQITDAVTSNLMPLVVQGRVDGAIVNLPISHPDVEVEALFEEEPVLVAPNGHPLAKYDSLTPDILAEFPLLLNPPGVPFRDGIDKDLESHGIKLTSKAEVDGMRLLASLATDGFGAAILPATAAQGSGKWKRIQLEGFTRRVVGLATNKRVPLSATTRVVRDVLRNMIRDHGSDQNGIYLAK